MKVTLRTTAAILAAGFVSPAIAEEQALEYKFTTQDLNTTTLPAPGDMGHALAIGKSAGTAMFADGRMAEKQFVWSGDDTESEGTFSGYSVYTFENGDAIHASFTGGWSAEGAGGDYTVVGGTGAYEGATGTGRFDAAENPWENTSLYTGSFALTIPDS